MAYDPARAHERYIHKRNSQYYKHLFIVSIATIIESNGCTYDEARKMYFERINKLKECYADV
jgi:hypothetical protein